MRRCSCSLIKATQLCSHRALTSIHLRCATVSSSVFCVFYVLFCITFYVFTLYCLLLWIFSCFDLPRDYRCKLACSYNLALSIKWWHLCLYSILWKKYLKVLLAATRSWFQLFKRAQLLSRKNLVVQQIIASLIRFEGFLINLSSLWQFIWQLAHLLFIPTCHEMDGYKILVSLMRLG